MSKHSFTKKGGIGSSEQDLLDYAYALSHFETMEKVLKLGAIKFGLSMEDGEDLGMLSKS